MWLVQGRQLRQPILLLTAVEEKVAGEEPQRANGELTPRGSDSDAMVVSACCCCRFLAGTPLSADFWDRKEGITLLGFPGSNLSQVEDRVRTREGDRERLSEMPMAGQLMHRNALPGMCVCEGQELCH